MYKLWYAIKVRVIISKKEDVLGHPLFEYFNHVQSQKYY